MEWGGGGVLLKFSSPLVAVLNIYVNDIHHILTFQTTRDTRPAAFYFFSLGFKPIQDVFQHDFAQITDEADSSARAVSCPF